MVAESNIFALVGVAQLFADYGKIAMKEIGGRAKPFQVCRTYRSFRISACHQTSYKHACPRQNVLLLISPTWQSRVPSRHSSDLE